MALHTIEKQDKGYLIKAQYPKFTVLLYDLCYANLSSTYLYQIIILNFRTVLMQIITDIYKSSAFHFFSEIQSISSPLKKFNIDYFCFSIVDLDGYLCGFLNNDKFASLYAETKLYLNDFIGYKEDGQRPGLHIWDLEKENPLMQPFFLVTSSANIFHGCSIIRIRDRQIREYDFGTRNPQNRAINYFYINHYDLLINFIDYFDQYLEKEKLIKNSHWFQLPESVSKDWQTPSYCDRLLTKDGDEFNQTNQSLSLKNKLYIAAKRFKLTTRELSCLELLINGQMPKTIAYELHLSVRTVETYLKNVRAKMACRNISQVIVKILSPT